MSGEKRRVNYVGWLGHKNLGDEALYKVATDIFNSYRLVPTETDCQDHSITSPITIIGGSTGIPEWFESLRPTPYNYIFGSGVKDPAFYGYSYIFRERFKVPVMMEKLRIFRLIGVRGNISKALLMNWGIQSEVIGDPCLSLRPSSPFKKAEKKIAISVGSDGILWGMNEERLFREIAKVCRTLRREGYEIFLIPFWGDNVTRVRKLAEEEGVVFFDEWFNVSSTMDLIAGCKIFIGQKLHSLGFAAASGTPFIGLEYQPKCYDFAESVGFENYTVRTDVASEGNIMCLFRGLLENYEDMRKELNGRVEVYRERQKQFAARIIRDIDSLSDDCWRGPSISRRIKNRVWNVDLLLHKKSMLWYVWNRLFFLHAMQYFT